MGIHTATVQKIYVAFFNRPGDVLGQAFWESKMAAGMTEAQVAASFAQSAEYTSLFTGMNQLQIVSTLYTNLFGRTASLAEANFWAQRMLNGLETVDSIALTLANSAQGTDKTAIDNKVVAATAFTDALDLLEEATAYSGNSANAVVRSWLANVTDSADSLTSATASVDATITTVVNQSNLQPGTTVTLTTGVDIKTGTAGMDTFDGSVNANNVATLTSVDVIDGGAGNDLLIGGLDGGNLAPTLKNIESAEFITSDVTAFDLVNTTGLNSFLMRNSSNTLTVNNIAGTTGTTFSVQDQAADFNLRFTNAALAGANTFTLNLSGAQSDGTGGADVTIAQQAGSDTTGLETVTVASGGSSSNFLDSLVVQNAAATSTLATLNVTGAQGLTVATGLAASVRTVDASGMTGNLGLTASLAATSAVTVTGSGGNDSLTFTANNADSTIAAGAGDDVVSITNFNANDSVAGGDGTADRLDVAAADAEAIATALTNTTGFEQLSLNTATTAGQAVNATRFGTIDTVRLDKGTGGAFTVTMAAGAMNLAIAEATAGTNATLGGALTVTDTGTASTDSLTITNRDTDTTSATDNFNGQNITINGYETVTINTGSVNTAAVGNQDIGTITLNNDGLTSANTLNFTGANAVDVAGIASNSSGLLTIDASGLTGTAALTMAAAPTYTVATGTTKITGSANADTLIGIAAASASTIVGGAGADTITGGSLADTISGDAGNDNITAGGGNDTVTGGDGNDTIDVTGGAGTVSVDGGAGNDSVDLGSTLTSSDVVVGGDGTDTLRVAAAATAATAASVSGFEVLSLDAAAAQGMEQFTNNTGFTQINYNAAANISATNASATVATIQLDSSGGNTFVFDRLVDTSSNSLTIKPETGGARTATVLTIDDEETVTIDTGSTAGDTLTIGTLNAADLTSLTVSGSNNVEITNAIVGASNLATINAGSLTGTFVVNASTSTANGTFTGAFAAANTITGGTGADTITGGTAGDSLTGGNGGDVMDGGAGADTLAGGLGNDSISGSIGDDTITGGVGNDTLVGGDGADDFVFEAASNGVDTISGFVVGTDDLDVSGNILAAVLEVAPITAAGAANSVVFADNSVYYVSMNGAAANLTNAGAATLSAADLTASTLTNLAAYLDERFATSATNGDDVVLAINWTAGGSTTTYVYEHVEADATATIQAGELTLVAVIDRGSNVLTTGDFI